MERPWFESFALKLFFEITILWIFSLSLSFLSSLAPVIQFFFFVNLILNVLGRWSHFTNFIKLVFLSLFTLLKPFFLVTWTCRFCWCFFFSLLLLILSILFLLFLLFMHRFYERIVIFFEIVMIMATTIIRIWVIIMRLID